MKVFKNTILFILLIGLITGCGKNGKKQESINEKDLIGRWQPEKIEFRDIPALIKKQIREDVEKDLLRDDQKKGYLELKDDGTFIMKDTPSSEDIVGKWSFNDERKRIEIESEELKIAAGNKELKIGFNVEFVSKDQLEIDYASVYKVLAGVDNIPIPFIGNVKMVMTYKRIK